MAPIGFDLQPRLDNGRLHCHSMRPKDFLKAAGVTAVFTRLQQGAGPAVLKRTDEGISSAIGDSTFTGDDDWRTAGRGESDRRKDAFLTTLVL